MKKAILTGASSGLGRALALELARNGYVVAAVGRNEESLRALAKEAGPQLKIVKADLTKDDEVEGLIDRCLKEMSGGPLTHLIHCAGYAVSGRVEDIPQEDFENCWRVNFSSAVSLARQALPLMKKAGNGVITHVGSGVARRALPYVSPYCSAKAALASFTESLRVEAGPSGVKVLYFSPGPVESGFHRATVHHGPPLAFPPFHGVKPEIIATKLFKAIEKEKERAVIGGRANLAHHLNYWAPTLTDKIVGRLYKIGS